MPHRVVFDLLLKLHQKVTTFFFFKKKDLVKKKFEELKNCTKICDSST